MSGGGTLECFAVTAPGLEGVAKAELADIGIVGEAEAGGVSWRGGLEELYRANLFLRTASRVLVRVARFRARSFIELERHLVRIDWAPYFRPGSGVRLRVTSRKSRLYHERAIEERFGRILVDRAGSRVTSGRGSDEEAEAIALTEASVAPEQIVVVRFLRDDCLVSVDASGALLHRRGYRQAVAKAPLRETLAAAMLLATGWTGQAPLLDPFCGSGTIAIEGALLARRIAPGLATADREPRLYAFQSWPRFEGDLWECLVSAARTRIESAVAKPIYASDRDDGAIEAARTNATRAGVEHDLTLDIRPLSRVEPPAPPGWLVSNPPYGVRSGASERLRDLYAALGNFSRERLQGWILVLLSADDSLSRHAKIDFDEVLRTVNGGIAVKLLRGTVAPG